MEALSLFELNTIIKQTLDLSLEPSYWVVAEIGEMRITQKGHCYMELVEKEAESIKAKIRANIWAFNFRNISGWFESITHQPIKAGMTILANASVNYHPIYGISLNIKDIDPKYTLGERAKKRQEIIEMLHTDGVFDMNRELEMPLVPQRIAVISSASAAGFGDFVDQVVQNENHFHFQLKLFPAIMQGEEAKNSIIEAMHQVFENMEMYDVLVITRGGGAQVDLDCFDTYDLASHVAQFPLPVITGIGHERDETIADLVAHTRMKTPTAVASFLIHRLNEFENKLDDLFSRTWHFSRQFLNIQAQMLENIRSQIKLSTKGYLAEQEKKVDSLEFNLKYQGKSLISQYNNNLKNMISQLKFKPGNYLEKEAAKLSFYEKSMELLNPKTILSRGYTITTIDGKIVNKIKALKKGMIMKTTTFDDNIESSIINFKKK